MERISFTRPAAARIARVVRVVENARPGGQPLELGITPTIPSGKQLRLAAFTGTSVWVRMSARQVYFFEKDTASVSILPIKIATNKTATAVASMFSIPGVTSSAYMATALVTVARIDGIWHVQAAAGGA